MGGQEVDELYARAVKHFKDDAMIHVFAAQYYNIYRNNHRIEQMHLTEAEVGMVPWSTLRALSALFDGPFHSCSLCSIVAPSSASVPVLMSSSSRSSGCSNCAKYVCSTAMGAMCLPWSPRESLQLRRLRN